MAVRFDVLDVDARQPLSDGAGALVRRQYSLAGGGDVLGCLDELVY